MLLNSLKARMEQNADNESIHNKLDSIISTNIKLINNNTVTEESLTNIRADISDLKKEFVKLHIIKDENLALKQELYSVKGKIARLEQKDHDLQHRLLDTECRLMEKNIVLYNFEQIPREHPISLRDRVYVFLQKEMRINKEHFCTSNNPLGDIRIDTAYRIGKQFPDKSRPCVVNFLTKMGKDIVMDKEHLINLRKTGSKVRISDQFPSEIREKRSAQVPAFKELKETNKNTENKIVLVKDTILFNKKPISSSLEKNPLPYITQYSTNYVNLQHTRKYQENGSTFQGHKITIKDEMQASAAKNALFQHPEIALSHHISYAYKLINTNGEVTKGHVDDGEIQAGQSLASVIEQEKAVNVFVAVSRTKNGPNLGKKRFDLIKQCATEAIKMEEFEDPDIYFQTLTF